MNNGKNRSKKNATTKKVARKRTPRTPAPKKAASEAAKLGYKRVKLTHKFPEGQKAIFANNFVIQHDENEFHLLFFQTNPPLLLGESADEIQKQAEKISSVETECVARIVVSAGRIPSVIQALSTNFLKYQSRASSDVEEIDVSGESTMKPKKKKTK